jgi:hypothetical protein
MAAVLQNLGSGSAVYYGSIAGIWVMILHKPPVEADMLLAKPSLVRMSRSEPKGFPTLTWIMPSAGFWLDPAAKKVAGNITAEFSESILARATLIDAIGFQAAAVRAIVTGIDLFTRSPSPGKVFTDLESTVAWCLSLHPSPPAVKADLIVRAVLTEVSQFEVAATIPAQTT